MASSAGGTGGYAASSTPPIGTSWSGYAVALGAVALSLLFRYGVRDSLGLKVPFLQFYPAIFLAAWYGGFGPGVLATVMSALAAAYSSCLLPGSRWGMPPINSRSRCSPAPAWPSPG